MFKFVSRYTAQLLADYIESPFDRVAESER